MAKKNKVPNLRPANDILTTEQLSNSRLAKISGSHVLFLVSPQILADEHATRHLEFVTRLGGQNVYADGMLRAKFWTVNFFDPSDWFVKFKKIDEAMEKLQARTKVAV
jgi:hypothetical protein